MAIRDTIGTALLDDFAMKIRTFVYAGLLLFATVAYGAGLISARETDKRSFGGIHRNVVTRQRGPASATRMGSPLALVYDVV